MNYAKTSPNSYLIRLQKGEKIQESLLIFCQKNNIKNAFLWALGSVDDPLLAHYRVDTKKYTEKKLAGVFEITNLTGNVAVFEDKPLIHAHVALSDDTMTAYGGHLVEAVVSATVEVYIQVMDTQHEKKFNEEIGLKLWDLPEEL